MAADNADFTQLLTSTSSYVNSIWRRSTAWRSGTPAPFVHEDDRWHVVHAAHGDAHPRQRAGHRTRTRRCRRRRCAAAWCGQQLLCEQVPDPPAAGRGHADPAAADQPAGGADHAAAVHAAFHRQRAVRALPPVHGLRRVRLRQLRRHRRVHHDRGRHHAANGTPVDSSGHVHDLPRTAVTGYVHQRDRHDHAARGEHAGDAVLRAAGAALRAPALGAGGRRVLGAAGLPGLPERRFNIQKSLRGDRPHRLVQVPFAGERREQHVNDQQGGRSSGGVSSRRGRHGADLSVPARLPSYAAASGSAPTYLVLLFTPCGCVRPFWGATDATRQDVLFAGARQRADVHQQLHLPRLRWRRSRRCRAR